MQSLNSHTDAFHFLLKVQIPVKILSYYTVSPVFYRAGKGVEIEKKPNGSVN